MSETPPNPDVLDATTFQGDCNDTAGKRTFAASNGSVGGAARDTDGAPWQGFASSILQRRLLRRQSARLQPRQGNMVLLFAALPQTPAPSFRFRSEAPDVAVALTGPHRSD
jgi:hypothetical protein